MAAGGAPAASGTGPAPSGRASGYLSSSGTGGGIQGNSGGASWVPYQPAASMSGPLVQGPAGAQPSSSQPKSSNGYTSNGSSMPQQAGDSRSGGYQMGSVAASQQSSSGQVSKKSAFNVHDPFDGLTPEERITFGQKLLYEEHLAMIAPLCETRERIHVGTPSEVLTYLNNSARNQELTDNIHKSLGELTNGGKTAEEAVADFASEYSIVRYAYLAMMELDAAVRKEPTAVADIDVFNRVYGLLCDGSSRVKISEFSIGMTNQGLRDLFTRSLHHII